MTNGLAAGISIEGNRIVPSVIGMASAASKINAHGLFCMAWAIAESVAWVIVRLVV